MRNQTKDSLITFENRIRLMWERGELPFLVHLCGGNEHQLIHIFEDVNPGDWILSSHRNHYHYLLAGGYAGELQTKIAAGKSMFVFDKELNFMSSAILGGMCGIAAGLALAIKMRGGAENVWCFLGDGAADNGHLYEASIFVESAKLPCTFVIEDNDRSCGVNQIRRGAWCKPKLGRCVQYYAYSPTYPHAGSGCAHKIVFNQEIVKQHADKL